MEVIAAGIFRRPQPIALRTTVQLSAAWGRCDARPRQPAALVTRVAIRAPALTPTRAVRWASGGSVSGGSGSSSLAKGFSRHADSIMQRESAPSAQKHKVDVLAQEPSILLPGANLPP